MIEDMAGMGARPMPKKTRRGKRNRGHHKSDPGASLEAAHAALDRGDLEGAKRLALAAVNALHRSSHTHEPKAPTAPAVAVAPPPEKPSNASRLVNALRFKKTA